MTLSEFLHLAGVLMEDFIEEISPLCLSPSAPGGNPTLHIRPYVHIFYLSLTPRSLGVKATSVRMKGRSILIVQPLFTEGFVRHKTLGICILKYFYWLLSPRVVGTLLKVPIQN